MRGEDVDIQRTQGGRDVESGKPRGRELANLMKRLTGKQAFLAFADWGPGNQKVYISDVQQQGSRSGESLRFRRRRESDD